MHNGNYQRKKKKNASFGLAEMEIKFFYVENPTSESDILEQAIIIKYASCSYMAFHCNSLIFL